MRLINAKTLELEDFPPNKIPPYTILSHTWGDSKDEVTFQDFSDPKQDFMQKPGFRKIKLCADQTSKDGLQYCWVDTCCIDKSSSGELSEAINSMFAWYKRSEICYIYMSDVDRQQSTHIVTQLEQSRWFTRGWTLQELVAPKSRRFFDCNWISVGAVEGKSRYDPGHVSGFIVEGYNSNTITLVEEGDIGVLDYVVSDITGIDLPILYGQDVSTVSLANRFSWASRRETTRIEDIAYCLLGLFDVNMPLLYGEGEKAFVRLQEEIIKKSVDETIFVWCDKAAPPLRTFNGLLAPSPQYFSWIRLENLKIQLRQEYDSSYEMTNNGLRIRLPLAKVPGKPSEYIAFLNVEGKRRYGITLRKLTSAQRVDSHNLYARVDLQNVYADHPLATYRNSSLQWIWVRQSCDRIRSIHMYDKVSQIAFITDATNNNHRIIWKDIITKHPIDLNNLRMSVAPGQAIKAKILLSLGSRTEGSSFSFGCLIKTNGKEDISSSVAKMDHGTRAELSSGNLRWKSSIELDGHHITTRLTFVILCGELVARLIVIDNY